MATDAMKAWAEAFARERPVVVFDQQGHDRTPVIISNSEKARSIDGTDPIRVLVSAAASAMT
jgi:hypothetical protein